MRLLRAIGVILSCLGFATCGTQVSREYLQGPANFFVNPPNTFEPLQVELVENISDSGTKSFRISASLKNSSDSNGRLWSDLLGKSFYIRVENKSLQLQLPNSNENLADLAFSSGSVSLTASEVQALFGKNIFIANILGDSLSSSASIPLSLDNVLVSAPDLSNRLLASCKVNSSDPEPKLLWSNIGSENLQIQIASFKTVATDSGVWTPTQGLFQSLFTATELATADQSNTATATITKNMSLARSLAQAIRVTIPNQLDRSLLVTVSIVQTQNTAIRYVGGCPSP